jgi:ribosome-associated protein
MQAEELRDRVIQVIEDMKGQDISALDVRGMTDITDSMIIASGTSNRHVKAVADRVVAVLRDAGVKPLGVEGEQQGEWILLDFGDVVVHVMHPDSRRFYELEKLWNKELEALLRSRREPVADR